MTTNTMPEVVVEKDYDGYFEGWVKALVKKKAEQGTPFKHTKIVVTAGPWRPYAVTFVSKDGVLHLDWYSALRTGFGSISKEETAELEELL